MQTKTLNSNQTRTNKTTAALMSAMRELVLEKGYAQAGTPQIVERAGVTRGALYHHFEDKKKLFEAVIENEIKTVAREITSQGITTNDPLLALKKGAEAFIVTMAENGRTRLILVEAPSVLGRVTLLELEDKHTRRSLREGLENAMEMGVIAHISLPPLLELLSAMFDSASLNIDDGMPKKHVLEVVNLILDGITTPKQKYRKNKNA